MPATVLLDAMNGERLSPITLGLASAVAAQYAKPGGLVVGVEIERYTPRRKNAPTMPCVSVR
ncbi:MAG: hypothetical protein IPM88_20615 [Nitrospira sp.]|nr:hypothetical protein [Nitrospira sp.]